MEKSMYQNTCFRRHSDKTSDASNDDLHFFEVGLIERLAAGQLAIDAATMERNWLIKYLLHLVRSRCLSKLVSRDQYLSSELSVTFAKLSLAISETRALRLAKLDS